MKKTLLLFSVLLMLFMTVSAQQFNVVRSDYSDIVLSFSSSELAVKDVTLFGTAFQSARMDGFATQTDPGMPALPQLTKIIEVPLGDGLSFEVLSVSCDTIDAQTIGLSLPIVPAQMPRRKSDVSTPSLHINSAAYRSNSFLGMETVVLQPMGVARNRNLARVLFSPVRWNPATNQLIVTKNITIRIEQHNADIAATQRMQRLHASPAFNSSFDVANTLGRKDNHTQAPLRYTIVANSMFRGYLDDFAAWKRRKGFIVDLVYTDDANVGSTTTSIQSYLQGLYDNATLEMPAPTYVLLVGDVAQLPAFYLSAYNEQHYSDLSYCCWTGGDNIPDCYYGRFSAQNVEQLLPQVSKTLMYEQYTFPDDSYLSNAALIAGVDGGYSSDYAYRYADPTMDYVAKTYINADHGFSSVAYYKNNISFAPDGVTVTGSSNMAATDAALKNLYNSGCGWVNYSAHGDNTLWHQPSFTITDVSNMTNTDKPMIMIGNCCLTNSFQVDACLGEALLRKGNNAGAVGYIGASNSTYWAEDFYWSVGVRTNITNTLNTSYDSSNRGMYDNLFHSHGEGYADWFTTMGGMIYRGNMSVESSTSSAQMKLYYWQIYHLMGDPSVMPYYQGAAVDMNPQFASVIVVGMQSLTVSGLPPYAYLAFNTPDSNLVTATFADASGNAELLFDAITQPGVYELVITAQGYRPYISTVNVISHGPYVSVTAMNPTSELVAGQDASFNVTVKNYGLAAAPSVSLEFQSLDGAILIDTTGMIALGTLLDEGQELNLNAVCHAHVWEQVADGSVATIRALVRWGNTENDVSAIKYRFTVNAPSLKVQNFSLDSPFDNGDTAMLTIVTKNVGHAALQQGTVSLLCLDPNIQILNADNGLNNVTVDSVLSFSYPLVLVGQKPADRMVPILHIINNGYASLVDTVSLVFGTVNSTITFESGDWSEAQWTQGNNPWELTNQNAYSGTWCARSKTWPTYGGNNSRSEMSLVWTSNIDDSITFYRRVSSEESYDFFRFYIDGTVMESASGTSGGWSRSAFFVAAGTHTFKFSYEKDASANRGSDCAWVDNITLPFSGQRCTYLLDSICEGDDYLFADSLITTDALGTGVQQFSDSSDNGLAFLTLLVSQKPSVSIDGSGTIRAGESLRLTATGADNYLWNTGATTNVIDVYPTETTTYTVIGMNGRCSDTASVTVYVEGSVAIDNPRSDENSVILFPNPADRFITIEGNQLKTINVCDVSGRRLVAVSASQTNRIDVSSFPKGFYFVQIIDQQGNLFTRKFVKD